MKWSFFLKSSLTKKILCDTHVSFVVLLSEFDENIQQSIFYTTLVISFQSESIMHVKC